MKNPVIYLIAPFGDLFCIAGYKTFSRGNCAILEKGFSYVVVEVSKTCEKDEKY